MKPLILALLVIFAFIGGGFYYENYYPPNKLKKATLASLNQFAEAVATKDLTKVNAALEQLLTDDAKIHLEVGIFAGVTNQTPPMKQQFDKRSFIQFIHNTLFSLTDYAYNPKVILQDSSRMEEGVAPTEFESNDWADGGDMFGGVSVDMRYTTTVNCEGDVRFDEALSVKLNTADCKVQLRKVPKPGQTAKFQNMESIQDLLMQR